VREKRRTERENKEGGDESEVKAERTRVRLTGKTQLCPPDYRRHMQYAMQVKTEEEKVKHTHRFKDRISVIQQR
jgi:hypothetical protein